MGRLFWKYFSVFLFTQLTTVAIVGIGLHWQANLGLAEAFGHFLVAFFYNPAMHQVTFVCMALIVSISVAMSWYLTFPIQRLSQAIQSAAKGDLGNLQLSEKLSHRHGLEILSQSLADLIQRLQQLLVGQTHMLHHVSHELRTPLARLQMATGLAMQNHQKVESALQRIELESIRMDNMITELLEVCRLESGMLQIRKTRVNICEVLNAIVTDAQFEQNAIPIKLNLPIQQDNSLIVYIEGQFDLLYRAIENVIRNAVKYSPDNGSVQIDLLISEKTKEMVIEVHDAGMGVSESELETIFLPFVRAKSATHKEGHGVGLAITKHIVEAHGGYVRALNLNPKGFMIRLHFPL